MARRYFGTDGMRGRANTGPITAQMIYKLALAAGQHFSTVENSKGRIVIGRDTRRSGNMIQAALVSGFTSLGLDVVLAGIIPTPAVAMLAGQYQADAGFMISASHNPFYDNGVKLFGADGYKLTDETELKLEALMDASDDIKLVPSERIGTIIQASDPQERYIERLRSSVQTDMTLQGFKVVLDCAHGAACEVGPQILSDLGADLITIGDAPDGLNINDGVGSTHPEALIQAVKHHNADIGIALDGDADRCILIDETGKEIDGDQLIALIATQWQTAGKLSQPGVVTTIMSNLGLENHFKSLGMTLERTKVGDRYVVEKMRQDGHNVGGEQSGHIVLSDFSTTGDGLLAALQALDAMARSRKPLSELGNVFTPVPQSLINVRYSKGSQPLEDEEVKAVIARVEKRLGGEGRLVIRKSGTEPLIRIMTEALDEKAMLEAGEEIATAVRKVI